jgi:DNA recombination protein RmuC
VADLNPIIIVSISVLAGLLAGLVLAFFYAKRGQKKLQELYAEKAGLSEELVAAKQHIEIIQREREEQKAQLGQLMEQKNQKAELASRLQAEKESLREHLNQHKEDLKEMRSQFAKDFEILANRIFEDKSEKFKANNKSSLDQILTPLKERIADFQKRVENNHTYNVSQTASLKTELAHLKDMSKRMTDEANNLTRALKNDSKTQGNWGEMIMANILESSGLRKDHEYFLQRSVSTEDGKRLQPDAMIKLPDNKWVVIDSKVSLTAYERYVNETEADTKQGALNGHLISVKNHFKDLSGKQYHEVPDGHNLDFILMFIPVEPAYLLALNEDQSLFNKAYDKKIIMVSPSTLIASLKIIASTWKHEYQNQNALDIANRGKLLLDKFIGFTEDFSKIGRQLESTQETYSDAMKKLKSGRGNLVSQAQSLQEMGVKSNKELDETYNEDGA